LPYGFFFQGYSKVKIQKMLEEDWSPQAAFKVCYNSTRLIQSAAASADIQLPLMQTCGRLYGEALKDGQGEVDMIAVERKLHSLINGKLLLPHIVID
jgi:3-hydroxyisobutyrate dehydrogenase-like beta-hydroxyacid dehydrogenase